MKQIQLLFESNWACAGEFIAYPIMVHQWWCLFEDIYKEEKDFINHTTKPATLISKILASS